MSYRGSNWRHNNNGNNRSFRGFNRGVRGVWRGTRNSGRGALGGPRRFAERQDTWGYGPKPQWKKLPAKETPGKRLTEEEIGVTEYLSDHNGFQGIIKSRYSDFQVAEINERGDIAALTDTSPPEPPDEEAVDEDEDLLLNKYNVEILPMETWDRINKLAMSKTSTEKVEVDVTGMSKEQRTKIHDAVKKAFGPSIVGSTVAVEDKKFVSFQRFRKGVRIDTRVKWAWPGEYVHFVVYKENCDTMEAAQRLAERLRINLKPSMLGYAGTKDRRAKTTQWFSVRKVAPQRISSACDGMREIKVGNFSFSNTGLRLGALTGNRFRIALRNVTSPDEVVSSACEQLKEKGFINYYGLQRFGTRVETPTYEIGRNLLQGNFKEAIARILEPRQGDAYAALQEYARAGAAAALRLWPRRDRSMQIEHRLLKSLAKSPNDLQCALGKLARNTRLLYVHSYQSYIWNRCVTERLKRHGLKPAVGDLVALSAVDDADEEGDFEDDDDDDDADSDSESQGGGENKNKMAEAENMQDKVTTKTQLETSIKEKQKIPVKVLTQEDVDSGKYTIFDVVLPLPGYHVEYPPNMKDCFEELLKKDGLTLDMKHKIKVYSMGGTYRRAVVRPLDAEWSFVRYSDPRADLLLSDWDKLEGATLEGVVEDGKYKALLLTLTLPASCYATMALRELLRVDTSSDNQAQQNNYHKENKNIKTEAEGKKAEEKMTTEVEEKITTEVEEKMTEVEKKSAVENKIAIEVQDEKEQVENKQTEVEMKNREEKVESGEKRKLEQTDDLVVKKMKQESDE